VSATLLSIGAVIGWVLLGILATLLGLALLLLSLPFHLRAQGTLEADRADGEARLRWAWGVVSVRLRPAGTTLHLLGLRIWTFRADRDRKPRDHKDRDEASEAPRPRRRKGWMWAHRHTLGRLLRRFWGALRLRLHVSGVIGLGDPAETASLFQVLALLERQGPAVQVHITPEWLDEELWLQGWARARIWGLHLLGIGGVALLRKDTRTLIRAARAARL